MEMAEESPRNPSFAIRGDDRFMKFTRSLSTKEPHLTDAVFLPPRRSSAAAPINDSQPPTPRHSSPISFSHNESPPRHSFTAAPVHNDSPPATPRYSSPRLSFSAAPMSFSHNESQPPTPRLSFTADTSKIDVDATYRCISSVLKKDGQILSAAAAADGFVYTGSQGNTVRVWKLPEFTECGQLKTKASIVVALQVSSDRVYAAYADCRIRIWHRTREGVVLKHTRLATVPPVGSFVMSYISGKDKMAKHLGPISSLAINQSDDVLYSASLDRTVKVWRISDFRCIETIQAHPEPINALVLAHDGVLYTASDDASVRVWRRNICAGARSHALTVTLPTKYSPVKTLALTPDGSVLYGGCTDGYIHYWLKGWFSGQLQYGGALAGHIHAVMCLATVGNYVISGSADSTARIWGREIDAVHTCVAVLQGHRGPIRCVAALPGREEGCTVCTGSLDGVIKVWRVKTVTTEIREGSHSQHQHQTSARDYFDLT